MSKISFRINTTYTSIENIFIDEYMPKAPAPLYSLVYIYGLRCACAGIQVDNKEIAEKFSVIESDVVNAWVYWKDRGLVLLLGNKEKPVVEFLPVKSLGDNIKETVPRNKIKQLATKPTYKPTDVADLMANNKEIEQLVKMAEATMGKILTQNDTQAIVSFYDWMGLPVDVITMLLSYYKDKPMGYIEKVAIDWSEKEIDTIEKVDKYMSRHKDYSKIMGYYGVDRKPTEKEEKLIRIWLDEYKTPFELIKEACQRTIEKTNGPAVGYTNGILKNWYENGINSIEAVEQMDKQFNSKIENNENNKSVKIVKPYAEKGVMNNSFNNFTQKIYTNEELLARAAEKNKQRRDKLGEK